MDLQGPFVKSSSCSCFCKAPPECENSGGSNSKLTFGKGTLLSVNPSKFEGIMRMGVGDVNAKHFFLLMEMTPPPKKKKSQVSFQI